MLILKEKKKLWLPVVQTRLWMIQKCLVSHKIFLKKKKNSDLFSLSVIGGFKSLPTAFIQSQRAADGLNFCQFFQFSSIVLGKMNSSTKKKIQNDPKISLLLEEKTKNKRKIKHPSWSWSKILINTPTLLACCWSSPCFTCLGWHKLYTHVWTTLQFKK